MKKKPTPKKTTTRGPKRTAAKAAATKKPAASKKPRAKRSSAWTISIDGVALGEAGQLVALEVMTEGEEFWSTVKEVSTDATNRVLYETEEQLLSLWRSPTGCLYATDLHGRVVSFERGGWHLNQAAPSALTAIWGLDDASVYAGGSSGEIVARLDGSWAPLSGGVQLQGTVFALAGRSRSDLYAAGERGQLAHFDGHAWTQLDLDTKADLHAVLPLPDGSVAICGAGGFMVIGAPGRWRTISGAPGDLYALAHHRGKLWVGAGDLGIYAVEGDRLEVVKSNVYTFAIDAGEEYLATAGNDEVVRYDGVEWVAVGFEV